MSMKSIVKKLTALLLSGMMCLSGLSVQAAQNDLPAAQAEENGRTKISFNNDWRFYDGDVSDGSASEYDDSKWLYVNTPHSTVQYTPENYYQKDLGVFWYRRHFETPEEVANGRRALLTFGAAMQQAEVWLNGEQLGTHQGGYTEFSFDITDYLKTDGSENVLAVRLDTRPNSNFAPGKTNPDFQYFGGLYRNVYVTVTEAVHITDAVSSGTVAGGGVFLTAPAVSKTSATVKAKTEVQNEEASSVSVTVLTEIIDEDGVSVVASKEDTQTVGAGAKYSFVQSMTVANPRLWSINTPELYNVRTTVKVDGDVCDSLETTYGIRKVEWKRDGCYINDERIELIGTNLHSEIYMLGNAIPDDAVDAEIKRLREYGFNFIRMAHYPHSQAYYEACDKYGVVVLDCLAGWQNYGNTTAFKENTYQQMRDMVRANRNHPCIVAWEPSLNESNFDQNWATTINQITKAEYPEDGISKAYTGGWKYWNVYDIGVGTPQANVVGDAASYSNRPIIVSEYGDWNMGGYNSSSRVTREPKHYDKAEGGDKGMLIQCDNIQSSFAYNRSKTSWYGAAAYWQYADYAGFDVDKLTYCGVVDVARIPKHSAYFFQSQRDPEVDLSEYGLDSGPMLYIANTWASDSPNQVRIYSNCDEVELYLDGQLIGRQTPDTMMFDPRGNYKDSDYKQHPSSTSGKDVSTANLEHPPFTFDLSKYSPGQGTLRAVGYIDGVACEEYIRRAPGAAATITLEAENNVPLKLDGSTAKLVWANVKDANGTVVNTADNEITFKTEGPGFVIGEKTVAVRGGQWAVWVRSQRGSGDITLTAESDGLTLAEIVIPTEEVAGLPEVPEGGDADETGFEQEAAKVNIFLNKATSASSVNTDRNKNEEKAEYANDGNESTKWCAKVTNTGDSSLGGHWWQVDLGERYDIETMEIVFDMPGNYQYQIAVSDDPEFTDYDISEHETKIESNGRMTETIGQSGRYVRIYLNCPASNIWPCLREVSGYGSTNNIALNKPASAQTERSGEPAGSAVDGDSETKWCGGMGPLWWQVDLEEEYHVNDVSLSFMWAGTADNGIIRHSFTLQKSVDGVTWTDVEAWSDLTQTDDVPNAVVTIPVNANARYLRVNSLTAKKQDGGANQWVEIAEFTATGEKLGGTVRMDYGAETSATSNAVDVVPENGNDGNPQTFWIPAADDSNPSWQFDAAGLYETNQVILTWNTEGTHYYSIELSTDGINWSVAANNMNQGKSGGSTVDVISGLARYVRVSVKPGTTDGFWINATGRVQAPELNVVSVAAPEKIECATGTEFANLGLPGEVEVTLEAGVKTSLPVSWVSEGYDAQKTQSQVISGVLSVIPGVKNADEIAVTAEVVLKDEPKESVVDIFEDVDEDDWFESYVQFVYDKGIMTGLDATHFGPGVIINRAQFATALYRMEGEPEAEYSEIFPDVADGRFYTDAVMWASSKEVGVIKGYDSGKFGPADPINREQLATMLYRYAEYKGYNLEAADDLTDYPDGEKVSDFAKVAMKWAVAEGIITGDQGKINPRGNANRAVCAVVIQRFMENVAK